MEWLQDFWYSIVTTHKCEHCMGIYALWESSNSLWYIYNIPLFEEGLLASSEYFLQSIGSYGISWRFVSCRDVC